MAENETLDLDHPNSARWRRLWRLIEAGEPEAVVRTESTRYLYKTLQNVCKLIPIDRLLSAAAGESARVHEIVRTCDDGRDYAQLFELEANQGLDRVKIVENVLHATLDRFLDQIGMRVVGSGAWPDFATYRTFHGRISRSLTGDIRTLAERIAANPHTPPKMPRMSGTQAQQRQSEILHWSALPTSRGSDRFSFRKSG